MFKRVNILVLALLLCIPSIRVAAQEMKAPFIAVHWLATNQIAVFDSRNISLYTPDLKWIKGWVLLDDSIMSEPYVQPPASIRDVQWSLDDKYFAISLYVPGYIDALHIWDMVNYKRYGVIKDFSLDVRAFTFSPDAQVVAISTLRFNDAQSMVRFFDTNTGDWLQDILLDGYDPTAIAWRYPDQMLFSRFDLEVWHIQANSATLQHTIGDSGGYPARYSPSGDRFVFPTYYDGIDTFLEIRDATNFQFLKRLEHQKWVRDYFWSNTSIVSTDANAITYIWNPDTGELVFSFETERLKTVELNPDGSRILGLTSEGEVILYDATTGAVLARLDAADLPEMP